VSVCRCSKGNIASRGTPGDPSRPSGSARRIDDRNALGLIGDSWVLKLDMQLDLTDEEAEAPFSFLNRAIDEDHFPLSPRIRLLRGIRAKFPGAPPALPPRPPTRDERNPGRRPRKAADQGELTDRKGSPAVTEARRNPLIDHERHRIHAGEDGVISRWSCGVCLQSCMHSAAM
jgi:hypothetical protein